MIKNRIDEDSVLDGQLWAPYEHITKVPGKRIRTKLIIAFDRWLRLDNGILESIVHIVEMLHNASLLVDDVEDRSVLRRGIPCAHEIYGMPRTINTSSYCMFYALHECLRLGKMEAVRVYTEETMKLHEGQGKEIYWRDTFQCPTISQYEKMVLQKTGGLLSLAVRLMELYSSKKFNFVPLIEKIALYFQIRDDYINLCSTEYEKQKGFAEDITEGKFSYPIILALRSATKSDSVREDDEILNILRQRTTSNELKTHFIRTVRQRGGFEGTTSRLSDYYKGILNEIEKLGGNEELVKIMEQLNDAVNRCTSEEVK